MALDYDRHDAILHWLFKQTQGDAWLRPNEASISSGVALRISDSPVEYRIFPYENPTLEPFERGVSALNPAVAIKVRNAAVHATLSELSTQESSIQVDEDTRIQVLENMFHLPNAEREQHGAFIRDERVLVVWSDSPQTIIPICNDFEERLIKRLWRTPPQASSAPASHCSAPSINRLSSACPSNTRLAAQSSSSHAVLTEKQPLEIATKTVRTWYGKKKQVPLPSTLATEEQGPEKRLQKLYAPLYNGLAAGLSVVFMGNGIRVLLEESLLDPSYSRFALCATIPLLFCVSIFFCLQLIQNLSMAIGPVAHFRKNSKYYSAVKPRPDAVVDNNLPHITIQMPVYRESLETVLAPSIQSLKTAMRTYARQGGTSSIFVNDDGLRVLSTIERNDRLAFYANNNIGWVARPKHDPSPGGYHRAGRFKKASNMNYGLELSLRAEQHLRALLRDDSEQNHTVSLTQATPGPGAGQYGLQYMSRNGGDDHDSTQEVHPSSISLPREASSLMSIADDDIEERALGLAMKEMYDETGGKFMPWAANARSMRMSEIILIVDSDTVVPEDCLRDAAREIMTCEDLAILQHESDVMQIAHHYFENGIAYFTRRINRCISMACANGEISPFMGHNAFLRWKALQDAAFIDPVDGKRKIWSESNVSEDFDIALRLMLKGYIVRWATYSNGAFKEGVSLTVDDELNRWQKYAYGCSELLFNPIVQWIRRGPINPQIHRFLWSKTDFPYKISMLAYMFSYYGIAGAMTVAVINYTLLGWQLHVDNFFMHSFEIWLATVVVFFGSGTLGYTLLEYRLGHKGLIAGFLENLKWIPFFFFFFGGLSIPLSQAILAHLFSYNISWSATAKEVERSNFFKELPRIVKRFWFSLLVSVILLLGIIIVSTSLVPAGWRIGESGWAVIIPILIQVGGHILFPIVLNPWLMVFSY